MEVARNSPGADVEISSEGDFLGLTGVSGGTLIDTRPARSPRFVRCQR
jgi:hypothetical protein